MTEARPQTRIQKKNRETILDAALDVSSNEGFRGATLDQIASAASLSKPNVLAANIQGIKKRRPTFQSGQSRNERRTHAHDPPQRNLNVN